MCVGRSIFASIGNIPIVMLHAPAIRRDIFFIKHVHGIVRRHMGITTFVCKTKLLVGSQSNQLWIQQGYIQGAIQVDLLSVLSVSCDPGCNPSILPVFVVQLGGKFLCCIDSIDMR